jgi:hypothetical protein
MKKLAVQYGQLDPEAREAWEARKTLGIVADMPNVAGAAIAEDRDGYDFHVDDGNGYAMPRDHFASPVRKHTYRAERSGKLLIYSYKVQAWVKEQVTK